MEDYVTAEKVLEAAEEPGRVYSDRRIAMMLFKAAKKPEWALANFYAHMMPHWTTQQLANFLGIKRADKAFELARALQCAVDEILDDPKPRTAR